VRCCGPVTVPGSGAGARHGDFHRFTFCDICSSLRDVYDVIASS